jgi:fluoride ion exporter CrcB/FEX
MGVEEMGRARDYVMGLELPGLVGPVTFETAEPVDVGNASAAVVCSEIVSFTDGVTAEQRTDIVNATLLAQLVANKRVAARTTLDELARWYQAYFDVLAHVGFVIQSTAFSTYQARSDDLHAHEAVLRVAQTLLEPASGGLAAVTATLDALRRAAGDEPWITLFNRESQSMHTARFQLSVVERTRDGGVSVSLMTFALSATTSFTQVLFFRFHTSDVTLQHNAGRVSINAEVLRGVREQVAAKLIAHSAQFIEALPDL